MLQGHVGSLGSARRPLARSRLAVGSSVDRALVVARVVVPLSGLLAQGWAGLIGLLLLQEVGIWLVGRVADDATFGQRLFVGAFALRAVLAAGVQVYVDATRGGGGLLLDDSTYDTVAWFLVRIAHGEGLAVFEGHQYALDTSYPYLLAGIYAVFGHAPLVARALNCAACAFAAVLLGDIARNAFSARVGRLVGLAGAVLPTMVVWGLLTLKEPLVLFAIAVALRALQVMFGTRPRSGAFANALLALLAAMALMSDLRLAAMGIVATLVPFLAVAWVAPRIGRRVTATAVALVVVALVVTPVAISVWAPDSELAQLTHLDVLADTLSARRTQESATARSGIGDTAAPTPSAEESPIAAGVSPATVGQAFGQALLSPAPWQVTRLRDLAASGEMVVWYVLLAGVLLSWKAGPQQPLFAALLALHGLETWTLLALSEGNVGNLLRHRVMLAPALLVLGVPGVDWAWSALTRRRCPT